MVVDHTSLYEARREAAEDEYLRFDFPSPVEDANGWQTDGSAIWRRVVFLEADDPASDSIACPFEIRFAPATAEIVETLARDPRGY